ncbi:MAG: hypothetical protein AAF490_20990 [Chloroflexota bacterium]
MINTAKLKSESLQEAKLQNFIEWHKPFFYGLLGSLITLFLIIYTSPTFHTDGQIVPYLFIFILVYPVVLSMLLIKLPTWQMIALPNRLPVIQLGFAISWLAFFMMPFSHIILRSGFYSFIFFTSLLSAGYGFILLKIYWTLLASHDFSEELFP